MRAITKVVGKGRVLIMGGRIDEMFQFHQAALNLRAARQELIASNIANAETPNFVPKSLAFEDELQGALKSGNRRGASPAVTHPRHIPIRTAGGGLQSVSGKIVETPAKTPGKDGNAVELENEMGKMTENQVMFNVSVQMLSKKLEGLRSAIREGK